MNETSPKDSHTPPELAAELARLVDGELPDEAYRALLAQLEASPHLWRACALAFLEAQAVRRDLQAWLDQPAAADDSSSVTIDLAAGGEHQATSCATGSAARFERASEVSSRTRSRSFIPWFSSGTLACALILAFLLGRGSVSRPHLLPTTAVLPQSARVAGEPATGEPATGTLASDDSAGSRSPRHHELLDRGPRGRVSLLVDGPQPHQRELPLYDESQLDAELFVPLDDLSHNVEQTFQQAGWPVQRTRVIVPLNAGEAQQIMVPVERVRVTPRVQYEF